jgi:hypothetical protein
MMAYPLQDLYTWALSYLGMGKSQVSQVLQGQFGYEYQDMPRRELATALHQYTQQRGGFMPQHPRPDIDAGTGMFEASHSPVARHMALGQAEYLLPGDQPQEGYYQYGGVSYPYETLGSIPGWSTGPGGLTTGVPQESKVVKYTRSGYQQGPLARIAGIPTTESSLLAQTAEVGEPIQRVEALLTLGPAGPEGAGFFDPGAMGRLSRQYLHRVRLPEGVGESDINLFPGQRIEGGDPTVAFPGHTGFTAGGQHEYSVVSQFGVVPRQYELPSGRPVTYDELVVEMKGMFHQGAPIMSKAGIKTVASQMYGLEEATGAQFVSPIRDPLQVAANVFGAMSPEERRGVLGRDVSRWEPGMYQEFVEKYVAPRMGTHLLPAQSFSAADPVTQQMISGGQLQNVEDVGGGMLRGQRQVTGFKAPFGLQALSPWRWQSGVIGGETMDIIRQTQGEGMYQHLMGVAAPRLRSLQDLGAAQLSNVEGVESTYQTTPAGQLPWAGAYAQALETLSERGVDPSQAPPGAVGAELMRAFGGMEELRGQGISFPMPGGGQLNLPNPATAERRGGRTHVEGMTWGLFSKYSQLMEEYQRYAAAGEGVTPEQTAEYLKRAEAAEGELRETTSSPAFARAVTGAPVGRAQFGGRFLPMEELKANRFFMGKDPLMEYLAPHVGRGVDVEQVAEDVIMGKQQLEALIWREPLTMKEQQMSTVLGFTSFPEMQETMPGLTRGQYEELGGSVRVAPAFGMAQGGDFDYDPYTGVISRRFFRQGGRTVSEPLAEQSTEQRVLDLARIHPAGEQQSYIEKLGQFTSPEQALQWMRQAPLTMEPGEVTGQFATHARERAMVGPMYNPILRAVRNRILGESKAAVSTRAQLGIPYHASIDEASTESPALRIANLVSRLSAATMGGMGMEGQPFNIGSQAQLMAETFRTTAGWSGEQGLTPLARATLLAGPEHPELSAITQQVQAYEGAESPFTRGRLLGGMMETVAGGNFQEWVQRSPLGSAIWEHATAKGAERAGEVRTTASGAQRVYTPTSTEEAAAERGSAERGYFRALYRRAMSKDPETGEIRNLAVQPLEERVAAFTGAAQAGVVPPATAARLRTAVSGLGIAAPSGPEVEGGAPQPQPTVAWEMQAVQRVSGVLGEYGGDPQAVARASQAARAGGGQSPLRAQLNEMLSGVDPSQRSAAQAAWGRAVGAAGIPFRQFESGTMAHDYRATLASAAATEAGGEAIGDMPGMPPGGGGVGGGAPLGGGGGMGGGGGAGGGPPGVGFQLPGQGGPVGKGRMWYTTGQEGVSWGGEWSQTEKTLSSRMTSVIEAIEKWQPEIEKLATVSGELNEQQVQAVKVLGSWNKELRQAQAIAANQEGEAAGQMPLIQAAQGVMGGIGIESLQAQAQMQQDVGRMGFGGGGGGLGGRLAGGAMRLMTGWTPMQMRRAWGMFGGPIFNQMIPAAAQTEAAGWGLTQAIGGYAPGMPEGVAGGVMQWQAQRQQAAIEGGRVGYRAWSPFMGAMPRGAQAIGGPALGAGLVSAIGMGAFGIAASTAVPIGLGIAGVGAAIGAQNYLSSFGESTAENQIEVAGGGAWERLRAGTGRLLQGGLPFQQALGAAIGGGASDWVGEQAAAGRRIGATPMGQLGAQERMASLNYVAQQLGQQAGTRWSGMAEPQILQQIGRFAAYDPRMQTMTQEEMISGAPEEWQYDVGPSQYEQTAGQLRMGAGGALRLTQMFGGAGAYDSRRMAMAATQYAPLVGFGITGEEIAGRVQSGEWGELTGMQGVEFGRLMGGDRFAWSRQVQAGTAPSFMQAVDDSGLRTGTREFGTLAGMGRDLGRPDALRTVTPALMQRGGGYVMTSTGMTEIGEGGQWGIQEWQQAEQRGYRDWGMAQQAQRWEEAGTYQRATWGIQDRQTALSTGYQRQQFAFQDEQLDMGDRQWTERFGMQRAQFEAQTGWQRQDMGRQWQRQQVQFGWAREDLAFSGAQTTMGFAWQMEDFDESIRYATGRQRRQLTRQRERATTQYGMQMGRLETQEGRVDQRETWAAEDHDRQRSRFEQRVRWSRERFDMDLRHHRENTDLSRRRQDAAKTYFEEQNQLREESRDLQREYWEAQHAHQKESMEKSVEHNRILDAIQNTQISTGQLMELQMGKWSQFFSSDGQFVSVLRTVISAMAIDAAASYNDTIQGGNIYVPPGAE